jgi:hypothetical protein
MLRGSTLLAMNACTHGRSALLTEASPFRLIIAVQPECSKVVTKGLGPGGLQLLPPSLMGSCSFVLSSSSLFSL